MVGQGKLSLVLLYCTILQFALLHDCAMHDHAISTFLRGFRDFFHSFFSFSLTFYVTPNGAHTIHTHTCTQIHTQVHENTYHECVCFLTCVWVWLCLWCVPLFGGTWRLGLGRKKFEKISKTLKTKEIARSRIAQSQNSAYREIPLHTIM